MNRSFDSHIYALLLTSDMPSVGITAAWDQKPGMNSSARTVPSNPTDPTDPTDPTAEVKLQL
jgi:hypothetical protein